MRARPAWRCRCAVIEVAGCASELRAAGGQIPRSPLKVHEVSFVNRLRHQRDWRADSLLRRPVAGAYGSRPSCASCRRPRETLAADPFSGCVSCSAADYWPMTGKGSGSRRSDSPKGWFRWLPGRDGPARKLEVLSSAAVCWRREVPARQPRHRQIVDRPAACDWPHLPCAASWRDSEEAT